MKLAAICCTYKRPSQLAQAVESFLRQDYPMELREMVVLDDAGQYDPEALAHVPGVRLVSLKHRFRTLGEKRNSSAAIASPDTDAYCVWDDDDIYLPWHMSAAAMALANADYSIPSVVYTDEQIRLERRSNERLFHGAWSFRRQAFEQASGYPFIQSGQDQGLLQRFHSGQFRCADSIAFDARPSYIYRWHTGHACHFSAMGSDGYERLGQEPAITVATLRLGWDRDWLRLHEESQARPVAKE